MNTSPHTFTDMMGNTIGLQGIPERIISVVPSQTELLFDLGLEEQVLGITKFCIHPDEWFRTKTRVGGTKKLNIEKIRGLRPDLIIANKEENTREEIELLRKEFPVWISDIKNLNDALEMIHQIGMITDTEKAAEMIVRAVTKSFSRLQMAPNRPKVLYLIWQEPYMSVNADTFINDMLLKCGFENVCDGINERYPELSTEEINNLNPDFIFLSSEPFPFCERHAADFGNKFPESKIVLVDGEAFSWYGSRLLDSAEYFKGLISEL
ncbi:MAG: helical backbone metal receptor [Bacteroidia bacterium]